MEDSVGYYHVCTDGMSRLLLFTDSADYISGMNDIPASLFRHKVEMLCFCLMSNHVHFLMRSTFTGCEEFIREFKRKTAQRLQKRYDLIKPLAGLGTLIKRIDSEEYLKTAIAYILRNPMAANIGCTPYNYRWSSGSTYFNAGHDCRYGSIHVRDMHVRQLWKLVKTRIRLPDDYLIDADGIILPENYIDIKAVERIFGSPKKFMYYLSRNDDGQFELEQGIADNVPYSYSHIQSLINRICISEFNTKDFSGLSIRDKCRTGILLKKRYGISARQFARLSGIDPDILSQIMI